MRAVLDPNVIISALLSPEGSPARVLGGWPAGRFELVISPLLLGELERALAYPRLRKQIGEEEAAAVISWLQKSGIFAADPEAPPPVRSPDPGDDYLLSLAAAERALLVSGDRHLLSLAERGLPIHSPAEFLSLLDRQGH